VDTARDNSRIQTICLLLIAAVTVGAAMHWLRAVLIPFVLSLFLAIALGTLVNVLTRRLRFPRFLAVIVVLVLSLGVLVLAGGALSMAITEMSGSTELYRARTQELLDRALDALPLEQYGIDREDVVAPLEENFGGFLRETLVRISSALTEILSSGVLVLIFVCFLIFGHPRPARPGSTRDQLESDVRRYIVAKFLTSGTTGILVGSILGVLGIKLAVVFGLLAFMLDFIPSIGPIIAVMLPVPIVLLTPDISMARAILAIALPGSVEIVIGNILEPKLMGKSLELHPITVIMAIVFWGLLWGIVGMFLATPMTVVARTILDKHELTRPVADLLAGRPLDAEPEAALKKT
jgi:AI-2 transport protein TqsA